MIKQLEEEIMYLKQNGFEVDLKEADGIIYAIFNDYPLPPGYNKKVVRLLLKIPLSYPNGYPDMFWTDTDLRPANGGSQTNTNIETALGEQWLRYSWHLQKWNPGTDNMSTYLEFVNRRLVQLK